MLDFLRQTKVLVGGLSARKRMSLLDESILHGRVGPHDLDMNLHMNNGRYLSRMDDGRLDLIVRTGMGRLVMRHRLTMVVGTVNIRFRRALELWDRYTLRTQVLTWDEKWLYLRQRYESNGRIAAEAVLQALILDGNGEKMPTAKVLEMMEVELPCPVFPEDLAELAEGLAIASSLQRGRAEQVGVAG